VCCEARLASHRLRQSRSRQATNEPRGQAIAAKNKVTVSVQPTTRRPNSAERRAAQIATLATQQATLKQEAADRRRKRAEDAEAASTEPPRRPHAAH
jgi:hypothetical protein